MLAASASAAGCDGLLAGMGYEKCDHGLARHASGLRLQDANRGDFVQEQATRLDQIHRRPISSGDALGAANAACADALAEVNAMVALGVRVIVLGVGTGLADDPSGDDTCLDALAHTGGVAASPGYPGFFTLSDSQQLHMVIEELFGGIVRPPCSVRLPNKVALPLNMAVYFDGKQIPRSQVDGWQLDSLTHPQAVIITGTYCDQIQDFQIAQVEVGYDCTPCVEGQAC
jgi:hypothetical protein